MSSWGLYWVSVDYATDENWFVIAKNARSAASFEESCSGFDPGDAKARRLVKIPDELELEVLKSHQEKLKTLDKKTREIYSEHPWPDYARGEVFDYFGITFR